jgi:rhodanese-related sulfurtransferase/mannose-6-phosphate isomerase-like protein (cupin superfamily)
MPVITKKLPAREESAAQTANKVTRVLVKTPQELAEIVSVFGSSDGWMQKVRLRADQRWYERVHHGFDYDIWLISWLPGQSTGFHDHGASSGALVIASGILHEHRPGERTRVIYPGKPLTFGPDYAHDVRNVSLAPAISIHAYSPPLSDMNEYKLDEGRLVPRSSESARAETIDENWRAPKLTPVRQSEGLRIDQVLCATRTRLRRVTPDEAHETLAKNEAILVDIRPERQRAVEGSIAGALVVERNVLEWRFDPTSNARLPVATGHDVQVIVFCSEGYTSSLAAAALQDLGLWKATDIIGGFHAWKAAGLVVVPPSRTS